MQAAVRIEIGIFQKLLFRQAGHRISGEKRSGERIHVGVVGLIHQVEKQCRRGILFRPVQCGMLKHMGEPGVINGTGEEGEVKHTVGVIVGDVHELGTCPVMLKKDELGTQQRKITHFLHSEAFHRFTDGGQGGCTLIFRNGESRQR